MKTLRNLFLAVTLFSISSVAYSQCDSSFAITFSAIDQGGNIAVFTASSTPTALDFIWDFGDNSSVGFGAFTQHYYQQPGTYYVCVDAWYWDQNTQDSCWTSTCQWITISGPNSNCDSLVSADFSWQTNQGTVQFTDASYSAGSQTWYYWQFGDGATSTDQDPVHNYFQNGQYYVCLDVYTIDQNGYQCSDSLCTWITISGLSDPCDSSLNTYFTPLQVQGNIWTFNNATWSIDPNATYFWWDFGDGTNSSLDSPTHTFPGPGTYNICLVSQVWNCSDTLCVSLTIPPVLDCDSAFVAQFNWSSTGGNAVVFSDASNTSGQQAYYNWNFGDGTYDYIEDPIHTYSASGQYYVCLDIWYWNQNTQDTCWSTYCEWVLVQGGNQDCDSITHTSDFSYTANNGWVSFINLSNTSGFPATYIWTFGDGNVSDIPNPNHFYSQPGSYQVCLYTAVGINNGADSCFSFYCDSVFIGSSGADCDSTFQASFAHTSSSNIAWFADLSNTANQQAYYIWSFGDGAYDYIENPIHTYSTPGQYYVCLDIWYWNQNTQDTCWSSSCEWVTISGQGTPCDSLLEVAFTWAGSGPTIQFEDLSYSGGVQTWYYWSFGDGSLSTDQDPFHTYTQSGAYWVCLTVNSVDLNGFQCVDSMCTFVTVSVLGGPCDSTFVADFSYTSSGSTVFFINQSNTSGQSVSYYWDLGDGSFDWGADPVHTYQQNGQYNVCLSMWYWDSNIQDTCMSTYCETVVVTQTAIAEHLFNSTPIALYPNPGNGLVGLGYSPYMNDLSLTITDLRGRVVKQFAVGTLSAASLDLRDIVEGVYLFVFRLNDTRRTERYILEE